MQEFVLTSDRAAIPNDELFTSVGVLRTKDQSALGGSASFGLGGRIGSLIGTSSYKIDWPAVTWRLPDYVKTDFPAALEH